MRRTTGNSSEIGISSKTFQEGGQVAAVDLGLKLQNQHRPFDTNDDHDGDGDGVGVGGGSRNGGPTCNGYNLMSDIYDVASSSVHSTATGSVRHLQPFDVCYPLFKPSVAGGMATAATGFPFTAAQWKELERQAMIYKYMVSSLPVPPDLLYSSFPNSLSTTFAPASYLVGKYGNGLNFRWVGNSKDAEPGRCRRTDGKKWRCSRDVGPNQKYCERHMHRGRPRSRKPVEHVHHHHSLSDFPINKNNTDNNNNNTVKNNVTKKTRLNDPNPQSFGSFFPSITQPKASTFDHPMVYCVNPFEDSRSLAGSEEQQWQQLVQTNMNSQVFQNQLEGEFLNLNSHVVFNAKPDMGLLERPLIDAWSLGVTESKGNWEKSNKASFSSSNGSHGGRTIDEDMCQIHMGIGVIDSWVGSPTSPGGPLAEVLRPGSVSATAPRSSASNPATSDAGKGDFVTPPATSVSSPSGVLQKTLASFSDSSGSSSPTGHNSKAKSDMPFHWLN